MKNFNKIKNILGSKLAILDVLGLINAFFCFKSKLRLYIKDLNKDIQIISIVDNRDELFRGKRIFTKEPETIEWIDSFFKEEDVFFDIGANVGVFSLYAAKKVENLQVFSFEPLSLNYAKLNENIRINNLDKKIVALPIALNDKDSISALHVNDFNAGTSGSQYNSTYNFLGDKFEPIFRQGCIGFTLDSLIKHGDLPFPNHIKIDVDGNEYKIIKGANNVLKNPVLRTIMIEMITDLDNKVDIPITKLEESKEIIEILNSYGFKLKKVNKVGSDARSQNHLFIR